MNARRPRAAKPRGAARSPRWLRWLVFGVPALLVCLVLLVVGGRWWLGRFLRSEDFRRFLNQKTSAALQAEARLEPLQWEGTDVYAAGFTVRGSPNGPLTAFDAEQVRASFDLGALWRRAWRVEKLEVERIAAELGPNNGQKNGAPQPRPDQVAAPGSDQFLFAPLLPNRMEIGELRVADFSLKWGADQPATAGHLDHARLTAHMLGDVKTWEVDGHGGTLTQADLPTVALDDIALKSTADTIFITRANGRPTPGGKLSASGKQSLAGDHALDLDFDLDGVPVESLLPPNWRGRLHGKANGHVRLTGSPDDPKSWRSSGRVDLREGQLEALPILDQLAIFSSSARYRHATVQRGGADFSWSPDVLQVRNVLVESEGLLRVEGDFTVRNGQIDGYFRVGMAVSSVRLVNAVGAAIFDLPQRDGYAWTTMHVTGPVDHWQEDLTARLATSAEQTIIHKAQQGTNAVLDTAGSLLDLLKRN